MQDLNMVWLPPYVSVYGDFYQPPTDAQYEAIWRRRVKANEERRISEKPQPLHIPEFIADCMFFKEQI